MKKINFNNKILITFMIILLLQISLFNLSGYVYKQTKDSHQDIVNNKIERDELFIADTVRTQERYQLASIKQSWLQYLETFKDYKLINTTDNGLPIYESKNQTLAYDDKYMYKQQKANNLFDIYSSCDNSLLLSDAKPQWNKAQVQKILNILITPQKAFGNNSGIIVFDSYSGEILLDTTPVNRVVNYPNITMFRDYENPKNQNPAACKKTIEQDFVHRKDSDRISSLVYMFNEPTDMGNEASNFEKYPLGKYNRLFIEKIILPYETIGFDGQPMQLTMVLNVDEQDLTKAYKKNGQNLTLFLDTDSKMFGYLTFVLIGTNVLSMIVMLVSVYVLKYNPKEKSNNK